MPGERFDRYLPNINADKLKAMARLWGGHAKLRKDESIATILEGLADPERVRAAVDGLKPFESLALALLGQAGGTMAYTALMVALHASGWPISVRSSYGRRTDVELVDHLAKRGLLLTTYRGDHASVSSYSGGEVHVFSDPRLLACAGLPEYRPFELAPAAAPVAPVYRRPSAVALDIIGVLQAIEQMDGLGLTQQGSIRVRDLRKIERAFERGQDAAAANGLALPDATQAWIEALVRSSLLANAGQAWVLNVALEAFAARTYAEQIRPAMYGFVDGVGWDERRGMQPYRDDERRQARSALLIALACLPAEGRSFFAVEDLSRALFERIGRHFSFDYLPQQPYRFRMTDAEYKPLLDEWQAKLWQVWQEKTRPWLDRALSTWLYHLGIVELGMEGDRPDCVRLTDLGRAILHPQLAQDTSGRPDEGGPAWIVQPNFDVVAYLEHARPEQLMFLERHSERVQAQQHTAHYRLTRESVYGGLESGTSLERLLATLSKGAGRPVPQNVEIEIREWAALREKITLYRRAKLLEFADAETRRVAMARGQVGVAVGDRFVRLPVDCRVLPSLPRVDYTAPLPRCLSASEKGRIKVDIPLPDLVIAAQLDAWAKRIGPGEWQLTAGSVAAAMQRRHRVDELLVLLDARCRRRVPRLLRVAVQAWAGVETSVNMSTVTILQCPTPEIFDALQSSGQLKPYLRGALAPDVLLVDTAQIEAVEACLAWAGIVVGRDVVVT